MKLIKDIHNKDGTRTVSVRLEPHETIMAIDDRHHYRLGGQVEDIMASHVIAESTPVYWCFFEQEWRAVCKIH